jgi:hypothetical protein
MEIKAGFTIYICTLFILTCIPTACLLKNLINVHFYTNFTLLSDTYKCTFVFLFSNGKAQNLQ